MKKLLIAILCFSGTLIYSQKYDNNWLVCRSISGYPFPNTILNFNQLSNQISINSPIPFIGANFVMSDYDGNILFYSNGKAIVDASNNIMMNGDSINSPSYYQTNNGYPFHQCLIPLPDPGTGGQYYIFHYKVDSTNLFGPQAKFLYYTLIDMDENEGLGTVTEKNQLILTSFCLAYPASVRHGNGRDWWIMTPEWYESKYNTHLLNPDGISGPWQQEIGYKPVAEEDRDKSGTKLFTPDGVKYIDNDSDNGIRLFDFDRCAGLLSNPVNCPAASYGAGFASVSPNSRFLYTADFYYIYQYDLWAADICASIDTVGYYGGLNYFKESQLGPDGKIYIQSYDSGKIHVINQPDLPGSLCQVEINAITIPCYNMDDVPYFPNYRLYDLPGSPCDTLGINDPNVGTEEVEETAQKVTLYPNPATDMLYLSLPGYTKNEVRYNITDPAGRKVAEGVSPVFREQVSVVVKGLVEGMYFISIMEDGTGMRSLKFVKSSGE